MTRDEAEEPSWFVSATFEWYIFLFGMVLPCVGMVVGFGVLIYIKEFQ